mmetsp:Transcript_21731/g.47384  ORF Transcript_21731/g.47384 Transcript_21731/m.47384 type:complete len:770 (+) Transcript_21731:127-2436(+)
MVTASSERSEGGDGAHDRQEKKADVGGDETDETQENDEDTDNAARAVMADEPFDTEKRDGEGREGSGGGEDMNGSNVDEENIEHHALAQGTTPNESEPRGAFATTSGEGESNDEAAGQGRQQENASAETPDHIGPSAIIAESAERSDPVALTSLSTRQESYATQSTSANTGGIRTRETLGSMLGRGAFHIAGPHVEQVPRAEERPVSTATRSGHVSAISSMSVAVEEEQRMSMVEPPLSVRQDVIPPYAAGPNGAAASTTVADVALDYGTVVSPQAWPVDDNVEVGVVVEDEEESKAKRRLPRRILLLVIVVLLLVIIITVSVVVPGNGGDVDETTSVPFAECPSRKIVPRPAQEAKQFGYALSLSASGNTALIGAYRASLGAVLEESGKAFIYVKNQDGDWYQEAELYPDDSQRGDHFGVKVALDASGDVAVVGADTANGGAGAVYVFARTPIVTGNGTQWMQYAKLESDDPVVGAQFGDSVAIQGDTIAVGASFSNAMVEGLASVYVFDRNSVSGVWEQTAKVVPDDAAESNGNRFGRSVAFSEAADTLVVGADKDGINGHFSGAAYIFSRQQGANGTTVWAQEAKIAPDDGGVYQYFGFDVDVDSSGTTVVVPSWKDGKVVVPATEEKSGKTEQIGSVYVFTRSSDGSTWDQKAKLAASDGAESDRFGCSVAITDDASSILVGAYHDDERRGSAYLFHRLSDNATSWDQKMKLRAENVEIAEVYGYQVSLDSAGKTALISQHEDSNEDGRYSVGSAHVVELDSCSN